MGNGAGAAVAAAAAAAAAEIIEQEEEDMAGYHDEDLREGWEFKILRANTAAFKKPQLLRQVCEEEARAGWVLLEKFDDSRLRFKRPASAKKGDHDLPFDAYRTQYGISQNAYIGLIAGITLGVVAVVILIVLTLS
jgi:hypothetical protein